MIIYKVTNNINGKIYIGQTKKTLEWRWKKHCKTPLNQCVALAKAIQKYGMENFKIEQIDSAQSLEELNKKEYFHIQTLNSLSPNGYNLNKGGDNREWSEESKKKLSKSHTGKVRTQESRKKYSESKIGSKNPMFGKESNAAQKLGLEKGRLGKQIFCHQNQKIYKTVTEAAKDLGFARPSISNVLIGFRKTCRGYTFEYIGKHNET